MELAEEYGRDACFTVRTRLRYLGSPLPIMHHAKDVTGRPFLGSPRTYTESLLKSWTGRPDSVGPLLAVFVELLVRSCLGVGDPDNGGVLVTEGLKFQLGL
jgi:hypothetical protein